MELSLEIPIFAGKKNIIMDTNERMEELLKKPVGELVRMIIELEEEVKMTRVYRKALMSIRNLATPQEERAGRGRPKKGE